jgi:hypothetical protein
MKLILEGQSRSSVINTSIAAIARRNQDIFGITILSVRPGTLCPLLQF